MSLIGEVVGQVLVAERMSEIGRESIVCEEEAEEEEQEGSYVKELSSPCSHSRLSCPRIELGLDEAMCNK